MPNFLSLSFTTTVLIAGGGVTPAEGVGCPGEVPAMAMVKTPTEVVDGSVPVVSTEPPIGTSSPVNAVLTIFWPLGSGGEEEGLQHRQSKHPTTIRHDSSTRRRPYTWWVQLRSLYTCVPPDNPEGLMARLLPTPRMIQGSFSCSPSLQLPSPPGGSSSRLSRRWAEHRMIVPFSLQLRRWGESGPVRDVELRRITSVQRRVSLQRILSQWKLQNNRNYSK
jgi:hypothetical protein